MTTPDTAAIPTVDRAWELLEMAYNADEVKVLGWADDGVMLGSPQAPAACAVTFTVTDRPHSHEDEVLIVAIRVPHPDEMTLDEVVGEPAVMTVKCPGGDAYIEVHAERLGPNHAACPVCGRRTSFHRITGRFARHTAISGQPATPADGGNGPDSDAQCC